MRTLRGRAADRVWQLLPDAAVGAAVDSSFEHALNLAVPGGLLTLVTRDGRPAPGVLITDAVTLPRVTAGTPARPRAGVLRVGPLEVDLGGCAFFSCQAAPLERPTSRPLETAARARRALDAVAVRGSFRTDERTSIVEQAVNRRLAAAARSYREALGTVLAGDPAGLDAAAAGLIGLGSGLTPTGDDYLVGALAVLTLHPHTRSLRGLLAAAVARHAAATTVVGAHYLRAAATGCFHHDVTRAAGAAITGSCDLEAAFDAVAAIGSTSGTDTLTGVVDTLTTPMQVPQGVLK